MLQAINDGIKGWLGMAIVALIALPFAFWGIQSYLGGGGERYAAKINGVEISGREFEYNYSLQRQDLLKKYKGQLPFEENILRKRVLEQLVNKRVLEGATYDAGYRISDKGLAENIKTIFSRDGKFDRNLFDRVLQARGRTPAQFEIEVRNEMRVLQLRDAIAKTGFATDEEARKLVEIEDQIRAVTLVSFDMEHFSSDVQVSEEEVKSAFDVNANSYMLPEEVSIEYVELKGSQLAASIVIDEQQIEQMYNDYVASLTNKEKRKASHILIKSTPGSDDARTKLNDAIEQLSEGTVFEKLAKEISQDPGSASQGGDLGWIEPGQMVKPFEDALFAMKEGAVSDIVESQFGLHLIKLEKIEAEKPDSLAEKRAEFEEMLKQETVSNLFYDMSENIATAAYESPDNLEPVAEITSTNIQTSELFTRATGKGISENEKIRQTAFSTTVLKDGSNSDIIEIAPNHIVVLRIKEHKPATLKPFDDVKETIESMLRVQKSSEMALAAAKQAKEKVEAGEPVEKILSEGVTVEKHEALKRNDRNKVDPFVLQTIFAMPAPEDGKIVANEVPMYSGDVALVILEKISMPEMIEQSRIDQVKARMQRDIAIREFDAALLSYKSAADLHVNAKILQ